MSNYNRDNYSAFWVIMLRKVVRKATFWDYLSVPSLRVKVFKKKNNCDNMRESFSKILKPDF